MLAILGPSISDNGLIARDLADDAELPCINYTGGEHTRSEYMFHYQVGSLEEEPAVLARHLVDQGRQTVAVIHDHSPVGRRYAEFFDQARGLLGLEVTGTAAIAPLAQDAGALVSRLRAAAPDALLYLGLGVSARTVALALSAERWEVPVVANSALMFGYGQRDWRADWEGWVYVDTVADDNDMRARLRERSRPSAAGPIGVAAYDMGRLLGEGIARARSSHPRRHTRRPGAGEAASGDQRAGGDDDGLRKLGPRRAQGSLPRAPLLARGSHRSGPLTMSVQDT